MKVKKRLSNQHEKKVYYNGLHLAQIQKLLKDQKVDEEIYSKVMT